MDRKEYNKKAINDIYKNAHIALQSINDILPSVENDELKNELHNEYEGYEKFIGELSTYMAEIGIEPKDINPVKKAFMWTSIKMKTIFDNSKTQIAEMMIKGTVMGITELTAMKNEAINLDEGVLEYLDKLLTLEESYEKELKKYL